MSNQIQLRRLQNKIQVILTRLDQHIAKKIEVGPQQEVQLDAGEYPGWGIFNSEGDSSYHADGNRSHQSRF
jgi:hypothetical protein